MIPVVSPASVLGNKDPQVIRIGVINERVDIHEYEHHLYKEFISYINRRLKEQSTLTSKLIVAQNVLEMKQTVINGNIDVLIESVVLTFLASNRSDMLKPSLVGWRKRQRHYYTVFFVHKDSAIKTIKDLPGHSIVFEIPRSTSAFHIPIATLRAHGIPVHASFEGGTSDSVDYLFAGSELNQAYWVHRGIAHAGAFNNGDWEHTPYRIKKDLTIIHETKPLLRWLVSFRKGLCTAIRKTLTAILLDMHKNIDGRMALSSAMNFSKFEQLTEEDFEDLNNWLSILLEQDQFF